MRLAQQFDTIEAGEIDTFAFNITPRVGNARILETKFICRMTPFAGGVDPDPASRVSRPSFSNDGLHYRDVDGTLQRTPGFFATALVGAMPASAAGGTYIIGYQTFLDDGRIIQGSATVQCTLQGG